MDDHVEDRAGQRTDDAVDRLSRDWLSVLLGQFIRASGLLRPEHGHHGEHFSLSEWFALNALAAGEPMTQRDLSDRLDLEKSTVSRLVAGLEGRGVVSRQRDPDNRRFFQVTITERGRRMLETMAAGMLERHAAIFAAMTESERAALATGLTALVRAMGQAPSAVSPDVDRRPPG
jgi:DNA-binding MarR family transcriptional regulator